MADEFETHAPDPGTDLAWLRPYARDGMLEWTRRGSLLRAAGETLGGEDAEDGLRRALVEARVEDGPAAGAPVPGLVLREPRDWGSVGGVVASAAGRLAEGGLLLIRLERGHDLARRRDEALSAVRALDALDLRDAGGPGSCGQTVVARRPAPRPRIALLPDGPGACLQIRTLGPLEELERRGLLELTLLPADAEARLLADQDLLILQRFGGLPAVRLLLAARRMGVPVALELDDDFLNLPWYNPGARSFRKFENRALLCALLRGAGTIVTSTPYLRQRMQEFNADVRTLHNLVDTALFRRLDDGPFHAAGVTTFGYIGTKTHSEDLRPVLGPLRDLILESAGKVRAVFIGHVPDELARLPGVRFLGWFATYQNAALALSRSGANVALAPLVDLEFNRSKSAMKYLEYGACGIPGIFSDVEAYRGFVRNGHNGLLVPEHTPQAWERRMRELIEHPAERLRMAEAAYLDVRHNHSIERRAEDFLALYRGIMRDRPRPRAAPRLPAAAPRPTRLSVVLNLFGNAEDSLPAIAGIADEFPDGTQLIVVSEHDELSDLLQLSGLVDLVPRQDEEDERAATCGVARALELARGEWVLCLEQGCRLPSDLAERLLPFLSPDIGALGPRTESPISAQSVSRILGRGAGDRTGDLREFARDTPLSAAEWLEPGCVLLQRQAVADCGGVDARLTWDDALLDLCVRLRSLGHKVVIANGVPIASGGRQRSAHASPRRLSASRERLATRLAEAGATASTPVGCDPAPVFGLAGERLDVWVWARRNSPYLETCLERIARHSDLPLVLNVMHAAGDPPNAALRRASERYGARPTPAMITGSPLLEAALATAGATHAVLLHDGVLVTPGWLRELLAVLNAAAAPLVVPFANDGSPEQRLLVDRGLSLETLDDMTRSRCGSRPGTARAIRRAGGFCVLLDLTRVRRAGGAEGAPNLAALTRPADGAAGVVLAERAYVHVLSHPDEATAMQMGPFAGGPFDVKLPRMPQAGGPLPGRVFLELARPLLAALRENPGDARLLSRLGRLYVDQGEVHNAMPFLERARKMDPFSPAVRESLAAAREALDGAALATGPRPPG